MAERIVVGDTPRLSNSFYVDGVATDPTTITLAVTDPSGTTDTYTYAGGTVSKSATGVYYKDTAVDEDGVWEYVWTGTGTAADVVAGSFTVWAASVDDIDVLTLVEAKQAVGLAQTNTDADEYLRTLVTAISAQLDMLCGPVRTRTATENVDGGLPWIELKGPIYSVTSVTEYATTTGTVLTAETNTTKATGNYLVQGTLGNKNCIRILRRSDNSDYPFATGRSNVVVVYVRGRYPNTVTVGPKFKQAAAMMLRNVWVAEMASGTETFAAFATQEFNPLLGPGMLNKVAALLEGEMADGVLVA
jgi:hypothetical protein